MNNNIRENDANKPESLELEENQKMVIEHISPCGIEWIAAIKPRDTIDADYPFNSDKAVIKFNSGKAVIKGYNDLATVNPELGAEWGYEKNGNLRPDMVAADSNEKFWWKCSICEYEWKTTIANMIKYHNCPVCAGKVVLKGYNDLATVNPTLAAEWDYEKNGNLRPYMFTANSKKKVWWKCPICGYEWKATIQSRMNGSGCPVCAGKAVLKGYNDLATVNPTLAAEWDYEKNGDLRPDMVTANSHKKVWWKCRCCGYEWEETVKNRTNGFGCPADAGKLFSKTKIL